MFLPNMREALRKLLIYASTFSGRVIFDTSEYEDIYACVLDILFDKIRKGNGFVDLVNLKTLLYNDGTEKRHDEERLYLIMGGC